MLKPAMENIRIALFLTLIVFVAFKYITCDVKKITFIRTERPKVEIVNEKYFVYVRLSAGRYRRANPVYYVNLHFKTLFLIDNNYKMTFDFFELLTNQYKPSFIQMTWRFCDLIHKDPFFGASMRQGKLDAPCPYPPDEYHLYNMTINPDAIPPGFPFTKGRICLNMTSARTKELLLSGHIDMEIGQLKAKNRIKNTKL